jgi:sarcosine oxidase subunit alpha
MVLDDGIAARVDQGRYFLTTSTGNAARVLDFLEDYRQTEFPQLKVWLTSVTEHWSVAQVAGPRAREVLEKVVAPGTDLSAATLPFMSFADAVVAGVPSRVFRVSFTGELSFEVYSPSWAGRQVWDAIVAAGEPLGLEPFGTEAMHVLRAEKGYVIVGQETDGTVTPLDLGLSWAVSKQKSDFVGKRSLARADALRADRKQLVGILTEDPAVVLPEGAQLTAVQGRTPPVPMVGHVTSSYRSEALGRSIALALVKGGAARHGERIFAPLDDKTVVACTIAAPVFYDPEGTRVHA